MEPIKLLVADDADCVRSDRLTHVVGKLAHASKRLKDAESTEPLAADTANERNKMIDPLLSINERVRILAENAHDVIYRYRCKPEPGMEYVSPSVGAVTGYTPEECYDDPELIFKMIFPDDQHITKELLSSTKCDIKPVEIRLLRKDGTLVWTEHINKPIYDQNKNLIAVEGIVRDITERKRLEEKRDQLEKQLMQAQKMEAIGQLAKGVAHDFNNQLTAILGFTKLAISNLEESNPVVLDLKKVFDAATKAKEISRELELFSSQHPMVCETIDMNLRITSLSKMLKRLIGENIALNLELDPALWKIVGDAGTIEQMIANLAINAQDAMPKGGVITMKTENNIIDDRYCQEYHYARPGRFICFSLTDTGSGIDAKILQRIFEPFFTTKVMGKGTGLGLSVIYGIVKQHRGWINVFSEVGKGTTFKMYFPATEPDAGGAIAETLSNGGLHGSGERILIVEDDCSVLDSIRDSLQNNGYQVFGAKTGEGARMIFKQENGAFDLIFSDIVLPDVSGIQLIKEFTAQKKYAILLTSGYEDEKLNFDLKDRNTYPLLKKPFTIAALLCALKKALTDVT